jgi:hypothetical protein
MDFNSLGQGSPFYILRKGEKPLLEVGVVKSKSQPRAQYPTQTPNVMSGMTFQQVIDVVAVTNGKEETFVGIPVNVEIASKGTDTFTGSREAMLQAVDAMLQSSKKALEEVTYHKSVIDEGEKMLEVLNPQYAENKKQARTITDLEKRQADTEKKLDTILDILRKLDSPSPSGV